MQGRKKNETKRLTVTSLASATIANVVIACSCTYRRTIDRLPEGIIQQFQQTFHYGVQIGRSIPIYAFVEVDKSGGIGTYIWKKKKNRNEIVVGITLVRRRYEYFE